MGIAALSCCPICQSPTRTRFTARDYMRPDDWTEWAVGWCDECEYGKICDELDAAAVAKFYVKQYYTHSAPGVSDAKDNGSFAERLRFHLGWRVDYGLPFTPALLDRAPGSFCDIGCGAGGSLKLFRDAGYSVVGVEPDPEARKVSLEFGPVDLGTAENIPQSVASQKFDVVLMSHVLEHCIDPSLALRNVRSLLDDGTLVIEVPNNAAYGFRKWGALWPWADIPRHLHFFTPQSLTSILEKSGLRVSRIQYVGYCRQFSAEWIATQDRIWKEIGSGRRPNFDLAAWLLLLTTAFASPSRKYDSVRIEARRA